MNDTSKFQILRTVILAMPITVSEISRKPFTIIKTVLLSSTISEGILYLMTSGRLVLGVGMMIFICGYGAAV